MIENEKLYMAFIRNRGVGSKDKVASSPAAYVSYLKAVSKITGQDISASTLRTETDLLQLADKVAGLRSPKTIKNYCTAMRHYIAFVEAQKL